MELDYTPNFAVLDYCILAAVVLSSAIIGVYASSKGNKSPEEFLMGNRSFGVIPISMSLLTSFVSSLSLLGFSGEAYANGMQLSLFVIGIWLGIATAGILFLPVLYPLKLTSVHEYIELRFNSAFLRNAVTLLVVIKAFIIMGFSLYAPTIALAAVTPLSHVSYIFILGIVCTFYSTIGGIRAVVWTDVLQLSVMLIGLIVIDIAGIVEVGGLGEMWSLADAGGRLNVFNMDASSYDRTNFYSSIAFGYGHFAAIYAISQINVQRLCSVPTINDAKKVLLLNAIGMTFIYFLVFTGGLITYAAYHGCDPLLLGKIKKKEEIFSFFVADRLSFIIGLPGLFVATLVGGTLSTLSSIFSAQVAIIWKDVSPKFKKLDEATPAVAALLNKVLTLLIGCCVIGLAVLASKAGGLIRFCMTVVGVLNGPIYGVYFLGILFPRCNLIGVWSGVISAVVIVPWIAVANILYIKNEGALPLTIELCNATTIHNITNHLIGFPADEYSILSSINKTNFMDIVEENKYSSPWMKIYSISYTLYPMLGQAICIVVAVIVSYLTGLQSIENVSPKYVSPFIRKFYWKEEQNILTDEPVKLYTLKNSKKESSA